VSNTINRNKKTKDPKHLTKWRKLATYFFVVCLLGYIASLFVLNSSWFKNKLTSKLKSKLPYEWQVEGITWVPFGSISINKLNASLGEGEIILDSIIVTPSWSGIFSGDLELNNIIIENGHLDLDLEWFKENQTQLPRSPQSSQKNQVLGEKTSTPKSTTKDLSGSSEKQNKKDSIPSTSSKPPPVEIKNPKNAESSELSELLKKPNKWLELNHFAISVKHNGKTINLVKNINLKIPIAGKPTEGEVSCEIQGSTISQLVKWDGSTLHAEDLTGNKFGLNYQWQGACNINRLGFPFRFSFSIPPQKNHLVIDQPNIHWSIKAHEVSAQVQLSGGLKLPQSWRGLFLAHCKDFTISENQKTRKHEHFDSARLVANYSRGKLHVPTAEALGYNTSILANGVINNNLYSYGVVRVITNNKSRDFFNRVHRGTQAILVGPRRMEIFRRLDTPDRAYFDLYFDGSLTDLEMRHRLSDKWQKVQPVFQSLVNFKDGELEEDGILEHTEEE